MMIPYFTSQSTQISDSMLSPVRMELMCIKSNEYIEEENASIYFPIEFDILSRVSNALDRYDNIEKNNWEQSGYRQPLKKTFSNTRLFLKSLPTRCLYILQTEDIEPTPYGTFVLDFIDNDNNKISVEIGKNKLGYFTKYKNRPNTMSEGIEIDENNIFPNEVTEAFEVMFS